MDPQYRQARLAHLLASQNKDGGWGYFPKKQSWLEPTCYALLALRQEKASQEACAKAWSLVKGWQLPDGSYRPNGIVGHSSWATALVLTLHSAYDQVNDQALKSLAWMLGAKGVEGTQLEIIVNFFYKLPVEYDRRFIGWSWSPDSSSWVEPTAHSILALKKIAAKAGNNSWKDRVTDGEKMLLDRRSKDGGWNYGNRRVLEQDLPSYPETTGIALLGLQGAKNFDPAPALQVAEKHYKETKSRLAKAWLAISLRNYGHSPEVADTPPPDDLMLAALEAIASPEGGHQWLKA